VNHKTAVNAHGHLATGVGVVPKGPCWGGLELEKELIIMTGVEITTCQFAKCEWNLELASNLLNLLASLASVLFLL
jgi:hypothetical protein